MTRNSWFALLSGIVAISLAAPAEARRRASTPPSLLITPISSSCATGTLRRHTGQTGRTCSVRAAPWLGDSRARQCCNRRVTWLNQVPRRAVAYTDEDTLRADVMSNCDGSPGSICYGPMDRSAQLQRVLGLVAFPDNDAVTEDIGIPEIADVPAIGVISPSSRYRGFAPQ